MNEGPYPNESAEGLNPNIASAYAGTPGPDGPAKRVALASLGAMATACDVANETFDRFVNRGAQAQDELQRRADEVRLQATGRSRVGDALRSAMNAFLDGINVPNKADVDVINAKLNIVTRKLDDLQFQNIHPSTPPAASEVVVPPDEATGSVGP